MGPQDVNPAGEVNRAQLDQVKVSAWKQTPKTIFRV